MRGKEEIRKGVKEHDTSKKRSGTYRGLNIVEKNPLESKEKKEEGSSGEDITPGFGKKERKKIGGKKNQKGKREHFLAAGSEVMQYEGRRRREGTTSSFRCNLFLWGRPSARRKVDKGGGKNVGREKKKGGNRTLNLK